MAIQLSNLVEEIYQALITQYGLLLRPSHVAELLDVSQDSLRYTMRRSRESNVVYLQLSKLRFGRRVRYPAMAVAKALALDKKELEQQVIELRHKGEESEKR